MEFPFVSEEIINDIAIELSESDDVENVVMMFHVEQPYLFAFLNAESFDVLSEEELDYLFFIAITIYYSCKAVSNLEEFPVIKGELIEKLDEKNWEIQNTVTAKKFRERVDIFFKETKQEDLLAFVEDSVLEEDEFITEIGREPIFIAGKTFIDACCSVVLN